jgi:hypothetical protein
MTAPAFVATGALSSAGSRSTTPEANAGSSTTGVTLTTCVVAGLAAGARKG